MNITVSYWRKISTNIDNIRIHRRRGTSDSTTYSCILCSCWLLYKNIWWNRWKNGIVKVIKNHLSSKWKWNLNKNNEILWKKRKVFLTHSEIHIVAMLNQYRVFDYLTNNALQIFYKLLNKFLMVSLKLNVDSLIVQMSNEEIDHLN